MEWNGKTVLVYGMGVSGKGVAELLKHTDASLILFDANEDLDTDALLKELEVSGRARAVTGALTDALLKEADILVLSPGISAFAPDIERARAAGVRVIGEIEIAYEIARGRMAAITGTNGKTTTTSLTGEIMKAAFPEVFVVGNIGKSFASVANETTDNSVIVAEISSFQLETVDTFHPEVSAVLNLAPDHLDRHGTFENYADVKMQITANQTPDEICVINYDDAYLRGLAEKTAPEKLYFSRKEKLEKGIFLEGDTIVYADGNSLHPIIRRDEMQLPGDHNVENVMAACGVAIAMGVALPVITETVRNFKAVEHRIEFVCEKNGVAYYNDSKGTNTDAAEKAVAAMTVPTILIAGGYDKGADFTDWIRGFGGRIKSMLLIGQTAEKIKETAEACGFQDARICRDLEEAVREAAKTAVPGEAVLLSPACASWDQFQSYEQRGTLFKEYVRNIQG